MLKCTVNALCLTPFSNYTSTGRRKLPFFNPLLALEQLSAVKGTARGTVATCFCPARVPAPQTKKFCAAHMRKPRLESLQVSGAKLPTEVLITGEEQNHQFRLLSQDKSC